MMERRDSRRRRAVARVVFGAVGLWAGACTMLTPPPSTPPRMPRRGITPRSYKMKLAVFNLLDPTGSGGRLSESIAETLHVSLFETERFQLMQRAELRGIDPGDTRRIKREYSDKLDGLVVGSITHFDTAAKTMTLNVNVMNPFGTTIAAKSIDVGYSGAINVDANRDDIKGIADWIEGRFPRPEAGRVISRSRNRVRINLGEDNDVRVGMGVLITAQGDDIQDPGTGELLGTEIYVGEAYVVSVRPGTCGALLAPSADNPRPPEVRVGDKVIFK